MSELSASGINIAVSVQEVSQNARPIRDKVVEWLATFCPALSALSEKSGISLEDNAVYVINTFNILKDFVEDEVVDAIRLLEEVNDASSSVETYFDSLNFDGWKVLAYSVPVAVVSGLIMICLLAAWFESPIVRTGLYKGAVRVVLMPLFGVLITFSWLLCSLMGLVVVTNGGE